MKDKKRYKRIKATKVCKLRKSRRTDMMSHLYRDCIIYQNLDNFKPKYSTLLYLNIKLKSIYNIEKNIL